MWPLTSGVTTQVVPTSHTFHEVGALGISHCSDLLYGELRKDRIAPGPTTPQSIQQQSPFHRHRPLASANMMVWAPHTPQGEELNLGTRRSPAWSASAPFLGCRVWPDPSCWRALHQAGGLTRGPSTPRHWLGAASGEGSGPTAWPWGPSIS